MVNVFRNVLDSVLDDDIWNCLNHYLSYCDVSVLDVLSNVLWWCQKIRLTVCPLRCLIVMSQISWDWVCLSPTRKSSKILEILQLQKALTQWEGGRFSWFFLEIFLLYNHCQQWWNIRRFHSILNVFLIHLSSSLI